MSLFQEGDNIASRNNNDKSFSYKIVEVEVSNKPHQSMYWVQNNRSGVKLRCAQHVIDSNYKLVEEDI